MIKDKVIFLAGHNGMAGSAIYNCLINSGYTNIIIRSRDECNLEDSNQVLSLFETYRFDIVIIAAAKVGGIVANNNFPVDFLTININIQNNLIQASHKYNVRKILFLGSSCIYPKNCYQPIKEEYLLSGHLEPTNLPYSIAKITGIELCRAYNKQYNTRYLSIMPCNMYGPKDNFDRINGHVLAALIVKIHDAKINNLDAIDLLGDGTPLREFLHTSDLALAVKLLLELSDDDFDSLILNEAAPALINVGSGEEISIKELSEMIKDVVNYDGEIKFQDNSLNGTPRKLLDSSKMRRLGWLPQTNLKIQLLEVYSEYLNNIKND